MNDVKTNRCSLYEDSFAAECKYSKHIITDLYECNCDRPCRFRKAVTVSFWDDYNKDVSNFKEEQPNDTP